MYDSKHSKHTDECVKYGKKSDQNHIYISVKFCLKCKTRIVTCSNRKSTF